MIFDWLFENMIWYEIFLFNMDKLSTWYSSMDMKTKYNVARLYFHTSDIFSFPSFELRNCNAELNASD